MSWENSWQEGRTGWDAGAPSPALVALSESGPLTAKTAHVPGCGSGYDVFQLAKSGIKATGLDLAPTAAKRFSTVREEYGLSASEADIQTGNFFEHQPAQPYDLVWDYTFLCALQPEDRRSWAEKMRTLIAPDGELVTLIFPIRPVRENDAGPPFQITPDLVKNLVEGLFEPIYLEPVVASHPGREGLEWLGRWRPI